MYQHVHCEWSDSWQRSDTAEAKGGKSSMSLKKLQSDLDTVDLKNAKISSQDYVLFGPAVQIY